MIHRLRAGVLSTGLALALLLGPTSCATRNAAATSGGLPRERPWGFNYDRDYKMRLLEDYWETEWQTVVQDFREMKALGANVVRVHLQFEKFMLGPDKPNPEALKRLRSLLRVADKTGLRLDLTGLGCYRKQNVPEWYDRMNEQERWKAQSIFWEAIARTCSSSRAVFWYDLMNEPFVPALPRKDWLVGELAGFWYVQAITLDPAGRDLNEISRQWIRQLSTAIRKHDRKHPITVGLLPNGAQCGFDPAKVTADLDLVCVHIYPTSKTIERDLETVATFDVGKPLVVEEIFPLGCSIEELDTFMDRAGKHVDGWISFYWGRTPEELEAEKTIAGAWVAAWIRHFASRAPAAKPVFPEKMQRSDPVAGRVAPL